MQNNFGTKGCMYCEGECNKECTYEKPDDNTCEDEILKKAILYLEQDAKQETIQYPILIIRDNDKEEFIHLGQGLYRTKWGVLNNSIHKTPLEAFDKSKFTFYYEK